jgi:hypothetical protein
MQPSTRTFCPVMEHAPSEARCAITVAISPVLPWRCYGGTTGRVGRATLTKNPSMPRCQSASMNYRMDLRGSATRRCTRALIAMAFDAALAERYESAAVPVG